MFGNCRTRGNSPPASSGASSQCHPLPFGIPLALVDTHTRISICLGSEFDHLLRWNSCLDAACCVEYLPEIPSAFGSLIRLPPRHVRPNPEISVERGLLLPPPHNKRNARKWEQYLLFRHPGSLASGKKVLKKGGFEPPPKFWTRSVLNTLISRLRPLGHLSDDEGRQDA